jgi:hypothetical protein
LRPKKGSYEISHRAPSKFHFRIFFDMLDMAVSNSYIIYQKLTKSSMSSLDFRHSVAMSLLLSSSSRVRGTTSGPPSKRLKVSLTTAPEHFPMFNATRSRCANCSSKENDCRSNISCSSCGVSLCLHVGRNCFVEYHRNML